MLLVHVASDYIRQGEDFMKQGVEGVGGGASIPLVAVFDGVVAVGEAGGVFWESFFDCVPKVGWSRGIDQRVPMFRGSFPDGAQVGISCRISCVFTAFS